MTNACRQLISNREKTHPLVNGRTQPLIKKEKPRTYRTVNHSTQYYPRAAFMMTDLLSVSDTLGQYNYSLCYDQVVIANQATPCQSETCTIHYQWFLFNFLWAQLNLTEQWYIYLIFSAGAFQALLSYLNMIFIAFSLFFSDSLVKTIKQVAAKEEVPYGIIRGASFMQWISPSCQEAINLYDSLVRRVMTQ
jgi:hypothetical protein